MTHRKLFFLFNLYTNTYIEARCLSGESSQLFWSLNIQLSLFLSKSNLYIKHSQKKKSILGGWVVVTKTCVTGMISHIYPQLTLTHWPTVVLLSGMMLFFNYSQLIFWQSPHRIIPLFKQKFSILLKNCCKKCSKFAFCLENWPLFFIFH